MSKYLYCISREGNAVAAQDYGSCLGGGLRQLVGPVVRVGRGPKRADVLDPLRLALLDPQIPDEDGVVLVVLA